MPVVADTKSKATAASLSADQKIIHLLNRIGYGPRPGDVDRIKRMGIDKYIDLQLHPERIEDPGIEARLANFPSLRMTLSEIQEKYPPPNQLARQLGLKQGKGANLVPPGEGADENEKREYRQQVTAYYREKQPQAASVSTPGASGTEDHPRGLQRTAASGSDDRFLVQPLQYLLGEEP